MRTLLVHRTYRFVDITVRSCIDNMYVSLSATSSVEEVDNITDVIVASDSDYHEEMSRRT